MMVFSIAMIKGIRADTKGKQYHPHFKGYIMNDIDPKQGKAAEKKRQQGTMNGTGQRSADTHSIPVNIKLHKGEQKYEKATSLQNNNPY